MDTKEIEELGKKLHKGRKKELEKAMASVSNMPKMSQEEFLAQHESNKKNPHF